MEANAPVPPEAIRKIPIGKRDQAIEDLYNKDRVDIVSFLEGYSEI